MRGRSWRLVSVGLTTAVALAFAFSLPSASYPQGIAGRSAASYANAAIADKALMYVGKWGGNACSDARRSGLTGSTSNYPVVPKRDASGKALTGGDGQCRAFVNCIVRMVSGGKQWLGGKPDGTYFGAFLKAGATEIKTVSDLQKGDIVQSGDGIHTTIIIKRVSGNLFNVVDSNHDYKETVLNYNRTVVLDASNRAFRLGAGSASGQGGPTSPTAVTLGGVVTTAHFGSLRLGMSAVVAEKLLGTPTATSGPISTTTHEHDDWYRRSGGRELYLKFFSPTPGRMPVLTNISTNLPSFKSAGVGVGSPGSDVRRTHPTAAYWPGLAGDSNGYWSVADRQRKSILVFGVDKRTNRVMRLSLSSTP